MEGDGAVLLDRLGEKVPQRVEYLYGGWRINRKSCGDMGSYEDSYQNDLVSKLAPGIGRSVFPSTGGKGGESSCWLTGDSGSRLPPL